MRFTTRTTVMAGMTALAGMAFFAAAHAQVRKIDTEKLLAERFGFTAAEIGQARAGRAVTKLLPSRETIEVGVAGAAPDAGRRANLLMRQMMLGHAQAYLKGGDAALGIAHNEKTPRVAADEFHALLYQSTNLYDLAPALASYLEQFPSASLPGSEQFLYWAKGLAGPEASISLHQLVVYNAPGGEVFIADKQIYASRYTDAALTVISLASAGDGTGYYALVGARGRSTMLGGMAARLLRGRVEKATLDTTKMYLDWIQQSLSMAR